MKYRVRMGNTTMKRSVYREYTVLAIDIERGKIQAHTDSGRTTWLIPSEVKKLLVKKPVNQGGSY
jgi:hypothetical protein